MFELIDSSHDRRVTVDEFQLALPKLEKFGVHISDPVAEFNKIDSNHGGFVLFDEFCHYCIVKHLHL